MNLKRVIKIYFYSILITTCFVVFGQNFNPEQSFVSVINTIDNIGSKMVLIQDIKISEVNASGLTGENHNRGQSMSFEFNSKELSKSVHNSENETEHVFANIHIKNFDSELILNTLKLKSDGIYNGVVKKLNLIYENEIISSALNIDNEFIFEDINFSLNNSSETTIQVSALFDGMQINDRFRFYIENKESLLFLKNGHKFYFKYAYPLNTPYLTIYK